VVVRWVHSLRRSVPVGVLFHGEVFGVSRASSFFSGCFRSPSGCLLGVLPLSLLCATRPPPVSNHSRTNTLGIHARAMSEAKPTPATTGAAPANAASGSSEHVNLKVIDQVGARVNVERHERMSGGERQGYPLSVFACLSFVCVCVCVCVVVVVGFTLCVCAHYCVARKRSALPHSPDHTASQAHELLL
jgi:hypothetical protein